MAQLAAYVTGFAATECRSFLSECFPHIATLLELANGTREHISVDYAFAMGVRVSRSLAA
jgi:hypothetical protein